MNQHDAVVAQAKLASEYLEEAGVRYMAAQFKPDSPTEQRSIALSGWVLAVLALGVKVQGVLQTLNLAQAVGLTEEEQIKEIETQYGVSTEHYNSIRQRISEMRRLEELGEGK